MTPHAHRVVTLRGDDIDTVVEALQIAEQVYLRDVDVYRDSGDEALVKAFREKARLAQDVATRLAGGQAP